VVRRNRHLISLLGDAQVHFSRRLGDENDRTTRGPLAGLGLSVFIKILRTEPDKQRVCPFETAFYGAFILAFFLMKDFVRSAMADH